jgi:hypothetical protein
MIIIIDNNIYYKKMCTTNYILIILFICVIVYFHKDFILNKLNNFKEGFETYKRNPYNYYESGATPLNFYEFPVYRKPYMYPQQFYKSYPLPHLSYYEDSVTLH